MLGRGKKRIGCLFDPYTGADLGDPESRVDRAFQWLVNLHDNLLLGPTGRLLNGLGAFFVTLLSLTGAVIWWPGIKNWRRSVTISRSANFARFNWDLHSAIGLWCSSFVFVSGNSGYLSLPSGLSQLPVERQFLFWITRLHFGRFDSLTEGLWTVFGLHARSSGWHGRSDCGRDRVLRKKIRAGGA